MQTQKIKLGLLRPSPQPRPLITTDVDKLAASIREVGLIQPITVRPAVVEYKGLSEQGFQIIAGHHRVAAVRALGWEEIDAIILESNGHLQAELIEIDENLVRSELTSAQRGHYTARRAEIREALAPYVAPEAYALDSYDGDEREGENQVGKVCPPEIGYKKPPPQTKSFAAETAALTGETKRSINQHRARGDALGKGGTIQAGARHTLIDTAVQATTESVALSCPKFLNTLHWGIHSFLAGLVVRKTASMAVSMCLTPATTHCP